MTGGAAAAQAAKRGAAKELPAKARGPALRPVARPASATLRDHAWAELRDALMSGRYPPGTKMTIRGLADQLGISPTPVREAVGRLAAEGAIEAQPNAWMRVPLLSAATLEELRAIRVSLEGMATARAVRLMTEVERVTLHAAEDGIVRLRPAGRPAEMIAAIRTFHFTLYRAARAPVLLRLIEGLWLRTGPAVNLLFPDYTGRERGRLRARVLRAVDRGDEEAARTAMEQDIGRALDHLIRLARARESGEQRP